MGEEDRWTKLEQILRRVLGEELDARGIKAKTRLGFANGRWTGVTEDQLSAWRDAYGSVDIDLELKKAAAWIASNPNLAPKREYARFMNTWLSRTQDRSSISSIPMRSEPSKKLCAYCEKVGTGSVGGVWHCDEHTHDAMDKKPVPHMRGVVAKPVSGS